MAYVRQSQSRRALVFAGAVLFQASLLWGLANGLVTSVARLITGPMKTDIIEEQRVVREAPPPPKPDFKALPPPTVVTPDFAIETPAPAPTNSAITENANKKAAPPAPAVTVLPHPNPRHPVTLPDYPPTSKRLGEHGRTVLLLTVDETGKVVGAEIKTSSGFDHLDEAAREEALRNWRLIPGTVGGKATRMQMQYAVDFRLTDQ